MNELAKSLIADSAFASPTGILEGLTEEAALARPHAAAPHSIYAEVWHLAFWQQISLDWVQGKPTPVPQHAQGGFPAEAFALEAGEPWQALSTRFLSGTQNAAAVANDRDNLETLVHCPTYNDAERRMTVRDQLESLAAHNAYHLGRIVLLRQLLGLWPPPSGGFTW